MAKNCFGRLRDQSGTRKIHCFRSFDFADFSALDVVNSRVVRRYRLPAASSHVDGMALRGEDLLREPEELLGRLPLGHDGGCIRGTPFFIVFLISEIYSPYFLE